MERNSYGLSPEAGIPDPRTRPEQYQPAERSPHSILGLPTATLPDLPDVEDGHEIAVVLRLRRVSDGALATTTGKLTRDRWHTSRTWLQAPLDPDAGRLVGNCHNATSLSVPGSGWIGATGTVRKTAADDAWNNLSLTQQLTTLLIGTLLVDHGGTVWEARVTEWSVNPY